jgi:eukaryotic-like serine/threonine-protein kinase
MKVLDFRRAMRAPDVVKAIQQLTTMYVFERDLLDFCKRMRISNVVTSILHGEIATKDVLLDRLYYIIFELADGDARAQVSKSNRRDYVWSYRALHDMAVSLASLHQNEVYHQDVKPSNVLVFKAGTQNKLGDLGRSHAEQIISPIAKLAVPGDPRYAPPEQLYGYAIADDAFRRSSGDLYLLGSMLFFLFTGNMLTPAILARLAPEHRPFDISTGQGWSGLGEDVLPYLQLSFSQAIEDLRRALEAEIPKERHEKFVPETLTLLRMLSDPDPKLRGYRAAKLPLHRNQLSLERFVSVFMRLSTAASVLGRKVG